MSKVTIKFWDKKLQTYFSDDTAMVFGLMVGVSLEVFSGNSVMEDIEPHFFVNGERIA